MSARALWPGLALLVCGLAFAAMAASGMSRTALTIPAALGWAAALVAARPLVPDERHAGLYFAFAIMAFMLLFVHETYGYQGKIRNFPLIVGYTGIVLSVLDILSLTDTRIGHAITRVCGAELEKGEGGAHRRLGREAITFLAMGAGVLGIWLLGFLIASPLFVFAWMRIGGGKSIKASLYGGFFTFLFIYGLFELVLRYELFRGELVIWAMETLFE